MKTYSNYTTNQLLAEFNDLENKEHQELLTNPSAELPWSDENTYRPKFDAIIDELEKRGVNIHEEDWLEELNDETVLTYDVHFNDNENSDSKGFKRSLDEAKAYIELNNGTSHSYFKDYVGGYVSIVCNETGATEVLCEVQKYDE